jgi:hypothetical protein
MKRVLLMICLCSCTFSYAQTITDGLMMPAKNLCTGFMYTSDKWTTYWEGELRRENGNIGSVTTQSITWVGNYGVTDNINVIAMVPQVKTEASQGTLSGMEGIQDLTLAVKYNFFKKDIGEGKARAFGSVAFSTPLTDYTPDFLPLSLGMATTNLSYRLTGYYRLGMGMYVNLSGAYTWRSNTTLDRPAYFTEGQQYLTDEVKMPNVFDYGVNIGYHKGAFQADLNYMQQNTLGGGDIRRQDMPFVSNRMNFSKAGAFVMYYVAKPKGLAVRAGSMITLDGRNVGKSTSFTGGLLYTIRFAPPKTI